VSGVPRKPRLHVPGGLYHVIARGNGRQDIFFDPEDRFLWESLLRKGLNRYRHRLHAYCWMSNHVHLAIQSHVEPLSRFMGDVTSQYARATNKKTSQSGHLFERRYQAILVQADIYLRELVRYIHLNPLRAGLVDSPADYRWSSHSAYLGGSQPDWLTTDWVLSMFGDTMASGRRQYASFMNTECDTATWECFRVGGENDDRVLGDDDYVESLDVELDCVPPTGDLGALVREYCQRYGVTENELVSGSKTRLHSKVRAEIGLAAIEGKVATLAEVAHRFRRSQSGMCRTINRLRNRRTRS
jgi:putative transposase